MFSHFTGAVLIVLCMCAGFTLATILAAVTLGCLRLVLLGCRPRQQLSAGDIMGGLHSCMYAPPCMLQQLLCTLHHCCRHGSPLCMLYCSTDSLCACTGGLADDDAAAQRRRAQDLLQTERAEGSNKAKQIRVMVVQPDEDICCGLQLSASAAGVEERMSSSRGNSDGLAAAKLVDAASRQEQHARRGTIMP